MGQYFLPCASEPENSEIALRNVQANLNVLFVNIKKLDQRIHKAELRLCTKNESTA